MNYSFLFDNSPSSFLYIGDNFTTIDEILSFKSLKRINIISSLSFNSFKFNSDREIINFSVDNLWDNNILNFTLNNFIINNRNSFDTILFAAPRISFSKYKPIANFLHALSNINSHIYMEVFLNDSWKHEFKHITFNDIHTTFLPSQPLFESMFSDFAIRVLPKNNLEDKSVYLFRRKKTVISLIGGKSNSGKTSRAEIEVKSGAILISYDVFFGSIDNAINSIGSEDLNPLMNIFFKYREILNKTFPDAQIFQTQDKFAKYLTDNADFELIFDYINSLLSGDFEHYVIEGGVLYDLNFKSKFIDFLVNKGYDVWDLIHNS